MEVGLIVLFAISLNQMGGWYRVDIALCRVGLKWN